MCNRKTFFEFKKEFLVLVFLIVVIGYNKDDKSKAKMALEEINGAKKANNIFRDKENTSKGAGCQVSLGGRTRTVKNNNAPIGEKYWSAQVKILQEELDSYRHSIKQNGYLDKKTF